MFATAGRGDSAELRRRLERAWLPLAQRPLRDRAGSLIRCDDPGVSFSAFKRAEDGIGVVARLACALRGPRTVRVWLPSQAVSGGFLCDARETNTGPLEMDAGQVLVPLRSRLTTLRLLTR